MIRGTIIFKCTECGHRFKAPDIEWRATVYSAPARCPRCSSIHTHPAGLMGWLHQGIYKRIWDKM